MFIISPRLDVLMYIIMENLIQTMRVCLKNPFDQNLTKMVRNHAKQY